VKVPKPIRIVDKSLVIHMRSLQCVARTERCLGPGAQVTGDHWKTKGAFGDDTIENLNPMCFNCHVIKGFGVKTFWNKYGDNIQKYRAEQGLPPFDPGF
jgi:hypothetical protein